ncbi:hypothetical protein [Rhizobium ruizarguesonis]|uniref:hypothetical protein n=1 Tax=Rhizobium ruizarguesonis TaxID=2081791 RepID=UPI001CF2C4DB|nr:hypothetical protein [Rhizobium ruizarguesonis]MCB2403569.1 hypothetical protein [Rhizobium ruizarguesonis]
MVDTILLSSDVLTKSLLQTGDALVAFVNWKPRRNKTVFNYPKADIHITAANGAVYLMSKRETKQAKIAFMPLPAEKIFDLSRAIEGAQSSQEKRFFNSMLAADVCNDQ